MAKAKDAFRTISEVAEWLDTPTHVLRFWESKFTQIKPVKGAGGRRYYRPTDMDLLGGIKQLLHEDGLTIKGTQKLLREKGVKHVARIGVSMTPDVTHVAEQQTPVYKTTAEDGSDAATPAQDMFPFDAPAAAPPRKPAWLTDVPDVPQRFPKLPARLIGRAPIDAQVLQNRAAEIAPLLARLAVLRERMHGAV